MSRRTTGGFTGMPRAKRQTLRRDAVKRLAQRDVTMDTVRALQRLLKSAHENGNNRSINTLVDTVLGTHVIPALILDGIAALREIKSKDVISNMDRTAARLIQSGALKMARDFSNAVIATRTVNAVTRGVLKISNLATEIESEHALQSIQRRLRRLRS